jgi:hypothetical protein
MRERGGNTRFDAMTGPDVNFATASVERVPGPSLLGNRSTICRGTRRSSRSAPASEPGAALQLSAGPPEADGSLQHRLQRSGGVLVGNRLFDHHLDCASAYQSAPGPRGSSGSKPLSRS